MTQDLGAEGEDLAADYLEQQGYRIIERNWHCRRGELDIIAKDGDVWVFCEVKTRRNVPAQQAFANITVRKRERLIAAAHDYMNTHDLEDIMWRIDAIGVVLTHSDPPVIEHVEDALDW